jgi:uncharacterized peroxidase-related enzyme
LPERERALCAFAVKLSTDQRRMSEQDLETLRGLGFDDTAIHDAVQVVAYFNYITRVADALGIDAEPGIRRWDEGVSGHSHGEHDDPS